MNSIPDYAAVNETLATEERYNRYRQKEEMIKEEIERFHSCKNNATVASYGYDFLHRRI